MDGDNEPVPVTEAEWQQERARTHHLAVISSGIGFIMIPVLGLAGLLLAHVTASGNDVYLAGAGWMALIATPSTYMVVRANIKQQTRSDEVVAALARQSNEAAATANREVAERELQAQRQQFEHRLSNALEMADDEPEVLEVIERSFAAVVPHSSIELLLADNSRAHLSRMASASPGGNVPGCPVDSPDHCPAARRAQVQRFGDSEDIDACPKLRNRPQGNVAAVCVPVSIMGRTVGVIHATNEVSDPVAADRVADLATLANLAGSRLGLLRVMADTQLQAATDNLTGLLNRRSFEQKLSDVRADAPVVAVAMADLDNFKALNDTFGHQTGDRALRLFAEVLRSALRSQDLMCRHGGEEFVIAFPHASAENARRALDNVRSRLDAALTVAGLPRFTVSFGLIDARSGEDFPAMAARADNALFAAKRDGRDRIVVHDDLGQAVAPAPTAPPRRLLDFEGGRATV